MIRKRGSSEVLAHQVEWMTTPAERTLGMLRFERAPADYAAIFELPLGGFFPLIHTFGMKFSIDIVFCSSDKTVVSIFRRTPPKRFAMPWKKCLGGAPLVIEFSDLKDGSLCEGDQLEWEGA